MFNNIILLTWGEFILILLVMIFMVCGVFYVFIQTLKVIKYLTRRNKSAIAENKLNRNRKEK